MRRLSLYPSILVTGFPVLKRGVRQGFQPRQAGDIILHIAALTELQILPSGPHGVIMSGVNIYFRPPVSVYRFHSFITVLTRSSRQEPPA